MKEFTSTALKGFAMGAANVIPGVSGGTIAFITGIYARMIDALKAFNLSNAKLLFRGKWREFLKAIDAIFLFPLFLGVGVSLISLASVLKWGFENHPLYVWALFFGLIMASIPSVGKMVKRWSPSSILSLVIGLAVSVPLAFLEPAAENPSFGYLLLCGVVAMCSMLIPGLSGSFVLLLMGNYKLVMLDSLAALKDLKFSEALPTLLPVGLGAILGLVVLSRFLSWLFKSYHDQAVALITGFVAGSLIVIWPWKDQVVETFTKTDGAVKEKLIGFENWRLPNFSSQGDWIAMGFTLIGISMIVVMDKVQSQKSKRAILLAEE